MDTINLGNVRGVSMNKAIEAAAMSKTVLEKGLIQHMTNERLEQLLNAIYVELRERDVRLVEVAGHHVEVA
jgi:hypothetical protein